MPGRSHRGSQVQAITSAPRALAEDVHARTVRYLVSMGIRTACFLLLLVVPGWWKWVCVAGAVILPGIAVLMANAGRVRPEPPTTYLTPQDTPPKQLPYDPTTEYLR
ncbi:DUF3099 domain-containing protein [Georgenia subflava]|uniref:DUF3099 domain-containing protein n=1 Tax=Georgenia subflava TaxID=1622177 RepID=A0A6N7ECU0_9MICO|nr:DUF3099 domain-containing protein [Georgenia subflava]